jgi:hypothetical protein
MDSIGASPLQNDTATATLALLGSLLAALLASGLLGSRSRSLGRLTRIASIDSSKTHERKAPIYDCTGVSIRGFADHSEQVIN